MLAACSKPVYGATLLHTGVYLSNTEESRTQLRISLAKPQGKRAEQSLRFPGQHTAQQVAQAHPPHDGHKLMGGHRDHEHIKVLHDYETSLPQATGPVYGDRVYANTHSERMGYGAKKVNLLRRQHRTSKEMTMNRTSTNISMSQVVVLKNTGRGFAQRHKKRHKCTLTWCWCTW